MEGEAKVNEQEEFEFRLRFERESKPSTKARIDNDAISQGARAGGIGSNSQNLVAGFGAALPQMGRGISQIVRSLGPQYAASADFLGMPNQADIDETTKRDKALLSTKMGRGGNIAGKIGLSLPAVAAGATLPAAAGVGAVMGAVEPVTSDESRLGNIAMGGGMGVGGVVAGRALGAVYQGGRALVEPFTEAGRTKIAGRMIQRFAEDPSRISNVTNRPTMTGAQPTLAEQTGDRGLARLQDSLRSVDPLIENQIGGRLAENNASRVNALRGLAGQDGARDFAVANRAGTAEQLYESAFKANGAMSPSQLKAMDSLLKSNKIDTLMKSPAIQEAMDAARTNAANRGKPMDAGSIEGLHDMKLALDGMMKDPKNAAQAAKLKGIQTARDRLVDVIETLSPDYKGARVNYAQMSKPVNSMDIAELLTKKGFSNGSDLSGNPTINRNALMGALKDEGALMKQATGRNLGNSLGNVMKPEDLNMLRAIASETDRAGAVATAGNGPGSATAQRMASQNVLRQILGPTGLPESWAENALANTVVGKPLNLIYGGIAEPKIQQALARAVLNPEEAKAALAAASRQGVRLPDNLLTRLIGQARRSATPSAEQTRR